MLQGRGQSYTLPCTYSCTTLYTPLYIGTIHSPLTHPHCCGPLKWARINCALKRSVAVHPCDLSDAQHLLCPLIKLGIRHTRKKEIGCFVSWAAGKILFSKECAGDKIFLTESWWIVCPVDMVCESLFTNHRSESSFINIFSNGIIDLINESIKLEPAQSTFVSSTVILISPLRSQIHGAMAAESSMTKRKYSEIQKKNWKSICFCSCYVFSRA